MLGNGDGDGDGGRGREAEADLRWLGRRARLRGGPGGLGSPWWWRVESRVSISLLEYVLLVGMVG